MANPGGLKPVLKGLAMLAVFGGLILLGRGLGLEHHLTDRQWILAQVQGNGPTGVLIFLGLTTLVSALGMPRQLPSFLGGYVFGWFWGTLLATLGISAACALDFTVARYLGRDFVLARFGKRAAKLDAFLRTGPFRTSLAIRLLPVGHNLLTSMAAGVTSIPARYFVLGSAVGYIPQNLVFAIFGGGVGAESALGRVLSIGVSVALLGASAWLGLSVYRAYKRAGMDLEEAEEAEG